MSSTPNPVTATSQNLILDSLFESYQSTISVVQSLAHKVSVFFIARKDQIFDAIESLFTSCNNRISSFYQTYSPKVKKAFDDNKLNIVCGVASVSLLYCYPLLSIIGAAIGFASKTLPTNLANNHQPEKIISNKDVALTAIGAFGLIMPACSLAAISIIAGTVGIGRAAKSLYYSFARA